MEFGMLLRVVGLKNLILILFCPISIQEKESEFHDFV